MEDSTIAAMGHLFLALSDKTRLRLLSLMANGEVSVGFLADDLGESQPKISRHLAYLRTAGLVSTRRDGKWIYYGIAGQPDTAIATLLNTTLHLMSGGNISEQLRESDQLSDYVDDTTAVTSEETHTNDWRPAELDVFLL